jgi:hypothetical protein
VELSSGCVEMFENDAGFLESLWARLS